MDEQKKTSGSLALNSTPQVITIPPSDPVRDRKLRVAAYARVSSSSEDQLNSFAAQNAHYTELITANPEWEFVDVYADKGITGTSAEKREDFQRLLADCRRGRVDKILVKSSSRFARNAKECLEAIRELKALGVGVCFEEQGIDTSELAGEFLTAIFAMMDQKESENISDNLRWSIDMRMRAGKYNTCTAPFGYRLVGGKLELIPEQAPIIRYIYDSYLSGKTAWDIAATLNLFSEGNPWKPQRIDYILTNERYSGNALLRKRYTTNSLPRKVKRNRGERPMYFAAGVNEAVVSQEIFDKAQELRKKRWENRLPGAAGQRPLANGWLQCGCCGKVLCPRCKNGKWYMACRGHEESLELCELPPISEDAVVTAMLRLYHKLRERGVPYDGDKPWNKNMTARILADRRYTGEDGFPQIIPEGQFRMVQVRRQERTAPCKKTPAQKELRKLCGGSPPAWVELQVLGLLNRLIRYPELITCPASAGELPPEAKKLRRELDELLCRPPVDEIQAKSLAFRLSSLQLDAIGPEKYETLRLRRMFQGRVPMAELEQELLHESVRRITVSNGTVTVLLKNNQTLEGGKCT